MPDRLCGAWRVSHALKGPPLSATSTSKLATPVPASVALHDTAVLVVAFEGGRAPRMATGGVVSRIVPLRRKFCLNVGHGAAPRGVLVVHANIWPRSPDESLMPLTATIQVLPPTDATVGVSTMGLVPEMV